MEINNPCYVHQHTVNIHSNIKIYKDQALWNYLLSHQIPTLRYVATLTHNIYRIRRIPAQTET